MNNKEINKKIGELVSPNGKSDVSGHGAHLQNDEVLIHDYSNEGLCVGWKKFDPCNNESDAENILSKYKIEVKKDGEVFMAKASIKDREIKRTDGNGLRAAMIVALEIEDSLKK